MNENQQKTLLERVESLLRVNLKGSLGIADGAEVQQQIGRFLDTVAEHRDNLERWLVPQWVVLAAGLGTRIDPTGRINKNLDVWFGGYNTLQLARRYLPGNLPHIVVVHPSLVERLRYPGSDKIDPEKADTLLGPGAQIVAQPAPDGTGGALRAAIPLLEESDADFIGVAFGDEPFLDAALFVQTLLAHFIHGADVTLCGKIPETVIDKGGLFFDEEGLFQGTKEWYDMTPEEQQWMWKRLEEGCAYTNTGITLIRREAALQRLDSLIPHGSKSEYHHVDLIRHCYEDGLNTYAHIYRGEITSGINRWTNVLTGQERLEKQQRESLARKGIRVVPGCRVWLGEGRYSLQPQVSLGRCCQLSGSIFLGHGTSVGDYSCLEDVSVEGQTYIGSAAALTDVEAIGSYIEDNPIPDAVGQPVKGLHVCTDIEHCKLDHVWVGANTHLRYVEARYTMIPPGIALTNKRLGLIQESRDASRWLNTDYLPGIPVSQAERRLPQLQEQLQRDWIAEATRDMQLRRDCEEYISRFLDWQSKEERWGIQELTFEQIAGVLCEIVRLATGCVDPIWHKKSPGMRWDETCDIPQQLQEFLGQKPLQVVWLIGDAPELPREIRWIHQLVTAGHRVTIAAKSVAVLWDATLQDIERYLHYLPMPGGAWRLMDTGSIILGIDLHQTNAAFWNTLINADLIIACGSNRHTIRGFRNECVLSL